MCFIEYVAIPIQKYIFVAVHLNVHICLNFHLSCFNMDKDFSFHVFIHTQKRTFFIMLGSETVTHANRQAKCESLQEPGN